MTLDEFRQSLKQREPPAVAVSLRALWQDANGNWSEAHEAVQDDDGRDAAWVHAYLHRKEGDSANARYWYGRAGRAFPSMSLEEEWALIARDLLGSRSPGTPPRASS